MAEKKEKTREEIISDWVSQSKQAQRAGRKNKRNLDEEVGVTINRADGRYDHHSGLLADELLDRSIACRFQ